MKLPASAKLVIENFPLGFVATVSADGSPCVSPKGTFVVLDDETIAFGDIRSPQTILNLTNCPELEVNFVDPFSRKGARIRGNATLVHRGTDEFFTLLPKWEAIWDDLAKRVNTLVKVSVDRVKPLASPPYDDGLSEAEMIARMKQKFAKIYP